MTLFILIFIFLKCMRDHPVNTLIKQEDTEAVLTLRRLMSCIYMEHPFLIFLDHTQRRSTVGRTPLDE